MDKFLLAYQNTMSYEGGYSNDPDDRGGETYKGISRNTWPQWEGWKTIDIYTTKYSGEALDAKLASNKPLQSLVSEFYKLRYWMPNNCDAFDGAVFQELFDTGVNQGTASAATYLQKALNKLNRNQEDYPDLEVDGKIGAVTIGAYNSYMATARFKFRNADKLIRWLIRWMNYYQLQRYDRISNNDLSQEKFVPGWTERA